MSVQRVVSKIVKYNDITLAFLLVAIIGLMIIPMPTFIVDALIGVNMGISFLMLMMGLYISSALDFSVYPTMLLITTLFRLALNITTTRLILLNGDAGEIVYTFGNFVVEGNFIVGAVVFLILTIVQFLVIAKGSERVAEVGARFTLDAMPGKQMSIDADLRAGVISMEEAQERRKRVTDESKLFGAMDGAMKFVKGDSIAGIIITMVNILGGIIIGTTQLGMSAGDSIQKYGILTIGDGLVSSIPSLLIAISAGVIITRSGDEDSDHLGGEIGRQIFDKPKAILLAGCLLCLVGLIPGFPKIQLFSLGGILGSFGFILMKMVKSDDEEDVNGAQSLKDTIAPAAGKRTPQKSGADDANEIALTVPLLLDISESLADSLNYKHLDDELIALRRALYFDLGVPFPGIHIRQNPNLTELQYSLFIHEVPVSSGTLEKGKLLVLESLENLDMMGVSYTQTDNFLPDTPSIWCDTSVGGLLDKSNISYMDHSKIISFHLSTVLARHSSEFIGLQETRFLLEEVEKQFPELVREASRLVPVQKIAEVLQRLVQEQVSVRNMRSILETLVEWGAKEKDPIMLVEYVRSNLKRQLSYMYSGGMNMLAAYLLDPGLEETVRKSIRQTSGGAFLALDPSTSAQLIENMREVIGDTKSKSQKCVLLASMDIRRYVRRLIEGEFYSLPVLSYQELTPEITVQPIDRIKL
ncbi:type III secretion system export apparatus subunit SctV [Halodesulfovibrio spirochaetisodalis]|uniref:Low calcium response locus protein D n=1 Tax=Halodesulfovibrio spirochaetisodalis TaxID=1560234 RepID=A0A1B7X9I7_9BACT|nr:type III secretion system export apparatus subunit SctV [Halodesulfovibrio spirochaetisodalis]OBQ45960.1 Low calcium response locus protein D [Halodesulfovibrio spirochaetisodalis]